MLCITLVRERDPGFSEHGDKVSGLHPLTIWTSGWRELHR